MAETIDEISINYEEDGILIVKELDKEVLSKGAWTTIIFRFQQWEKGKEQYSADRFTIRRYQKREGNYSPKSKFNISSKDQALKIASILEKWAK